MKSIWSTSAAIILPAAFAFAGSMCQAAGLPEEKPNILLIVADDMGYSDLGCFGGEINTPNIDALAARGLRATNFYVAPSCSPSRSMLLAGTDSHIAGIGNMAEWTGPTQRGKPGYEGHLNARVITVASLLREAGYHTSMAAKWHLGEKPEQWPSQRGFERDFALLQGAGSHWSDMLGLLPSEPRVTFTRNGELVKELPADYYSSKYFTDFIIESIEENGSDGKPFFAYLGYQAPHGPLAVPAEWRDKYKGRYDEGYDAIRAERLDRQKKLGIVGQNVVTFPRLPNIPAWEALTNEQRRQAARKMELYAAMIEYMDDQIGRLIDHLKKTGKYDNTLIIFLSDNGAAGEDMAELINKLAPTAKDWFDKTFDNRPENWGHPGSCVEYGPSWAQVSSVPFRLFKGVVAEGGIRAPLVVSGPGIKHAGAINHSVLHVMDLMPTFLESAGVEHPAQHAGSKFAPPQGTSMWPLLVGRETATRTDADWLGWELFGNRAIRQGDWKLLYLLKGAGGTGDWELFNLRDDPAELHALSATYPDKRKALLDLWDEYVKRNGVIVSEAGPYGPSNPKITGSENLMKMHQVSDHCFAVINEKNRVCDANSGLINCGGGVVIDTQSDLAHARQMIEMFGKVWPAMPQRVINTHEDADHVWGNQLFAGAEIIAHRSVPDRMKQVAEPQESQKLLHGVGRFLTRLVLKTLHPGLEAAGEQLLEDYNFDGIELVLPTTLFDARYELNLDGKEAHLIYVGPCHQVGDTIIHVPEERVVFAGDVLFRQCTPMGWTGSYEKWFKCLDLLIELEPEAIVPGHGPLCGIEGPMEMKAYLQYVRDESRKCFDEEITSLEAAKRIEFGPYGEWRAPARLYMNVERAYREFRNEPPDAPWDSAATFDAIYQVAKAKGIEAEF